MEGLIGGASMGGGVGQRFNRFLKFDNGTRPTVGHEQRARVLMVGSNMQKMHTQALELGFKAGPTIQ